MTTPLLTVEEFKRRSKSLLEGTINDLYLREMIRGASELLETATDRRLDAWYESRRYDASAISFGGDLIDSADLILDADLISLSKLLFAIDGDNNPNGTEITAGYELIPQSTWRGITAYTRIRLRPFNPFFRWEDDELWLGGGTDPVQSIAVQGLWGYNIRFTATGAALDGAVTDESAEVLTVTGEDNLEIDMMIRLNDEFMLIAAIDTTAHTITVERGYNGSTAADHVDQTVIKRQHAGDLIKNLTARLTGFMIAQNDSPMYGQTVIAGNVATVTADSLPADVLKTLYTSGYRRVQPPRPI